MSDEAAKLDAPALAAAGRAPRLPFSLDCADGETLLVRRLLRVLPGRRIVGEARYRGQTVLAKIFVGRAAGRRWRQERDGLAALAAQGIPTPVVLLAAPLPTAGFLLLTEFVAASGTLADAWCGLARPAPGDAAAVAVLRPAFVLLARMHARGLVQEDMHLGNFLRGGDDVFVIDGDAVRAISPGVPVGGRIALRNLALLLAQLPDAWDALPAELLDAYGEENPGRSFSRDELQREAGRLRSWRLQQFLAKTGRDCTLFSVARTFGRFVAVARNETDTLADLLADPDGVVAGGRLLKDGTTCTVAQVAAAGRSLVVKRYNLKGVGHALKRFWRASRAWHSWREAHRLRFLGIPTPLPLAIVEERIGPLRGRAFLVTEHCAGPRLLEHLRPEAVPAAAEAEAILALFDALHRHRISHGDLKASNLIWCDGKVFVVDLDAMVQHRSAEAHARSWRRDRARLLRNWPESSVLHRWLAEHLPAP